jgi:hypothetical protein
MYVKELKGLHSEFEGLLPQMNNDWVEDQHWSTEHTVKSVSDSIR